MNMQVMYNDNIVGQIDSVLLNRLIETGKVKMFMRSDGWAMVGVSPVRGDGGLYEGVDRRGRYGLEADLKYKIIT
ncbi:MAG TPA: hypothetical protein PK986_06390 [Spirochaetota bacterium]|nr:hypothetical protein [Spirochaetota bacterium]HQO40078.1 hypothetical protein [Spirochaetota bacterium]